MKEVKPETPLESIRKGDGKGRINPGLYIHPKPKYCMVLDPVGLSYALVFDEHVQICQNRMTSPGITLEAARKIVRVIDTFEKEVKEKKSIFLKSILLKSKDVDIGDGRKFSIGGFGYKVGKFSQSGHASAFLLRSLLNAFIWSKCRDDMGPFENDYGELRTLGQIERFGNVDKFITWHVSINDDRLLTEKCRLDISGPFDSFRYHIGTEEALGELISGIKKLLNSDDIHYQFKDLKSIENGLRIWKFKTPDGDIAVGISTDLLLPNQRTFLFFGKESGENFLKFLRKAKKLFK